MRSRHEHGTGRDAQRLLEEAAIGQSLANLRTFPWSRSAKQTATLSLLGCHFSIREGDFMCSTRRKMTSAPSSNSRTALSD